MTTNLNAKVFQLLDDLEALDRQAKARVLERFIATELALTQEPKYLDFSDLEVIRARAAQIWTEEPVHSELSVETRTRGPEYLRTACLVHATVEFLRGQGYLTHLISFRKSHRNRPPR